MNDQSPINAAFECDAADFRAKLQACLIAVSAEETRYYLCGIFIRSNGKIVEMAGCDGHRLVCAQFEAIFVGIVPGSAIIPTKVAKSLVKWLYKRTGSIRVAILNREATFTQGDTVFTAELIDGTYPDYYRVLPNANTLHQALKIDRKKLASALNVLRSVRLDSRPVELGGKFYQTTASPHVRINYIDGKLFISRIFDTSEFERFETSRVITKGKRRGEKVVSANFHEIATDATVEKREVEVTSPPYSQKPFEIGMNVHYLAELIGTRGKFVKLQFSEDMGPCRVDCEDKLTRVLMPARV